MPPVCMGGGGEDPEQVTFEYCDINSSYYLTTPYDLLVSFYVLEHIQVWESVIDYWVQSNIKYIIIFVPIGKMYKNDLREHFRHFKKYEIKEYMLASGYKLLNAFYWGFPFYYPITKIAIELQRGTIHNTMAKKPSFFLKRVYDIMYFFYTKCCSKKIGGDFIGFFEKIS